MRKQVVQRSLEDLQKEALEFTTNWLILEPELPAEMLADRIVSEAEPELLQPLGRVLLVRHFAGLVKSVRTQQRATKPKPAPLFPEWEALPARIITPAGRVSLKAANVTQLRAYLKVLQERQAERMEGSKLQRRIEQVEALIGLMREHAGAKHGITAAEVAAIR
jgi:hypothetical protein